MKVEVGLVAGAIGGRRPHGGRRVLPFKWRGAVGGPRAVS